MPTDRSATVWAATFVPAKSPFPEYGQDGYSAAWVDTPHGRIQVLVDGARPAPGTSGRLVETTLGESVVDIFVADGS